MDLRNLLVFCAFIINLFLSILIHLRSAKTKANVTFEVTAFGITFWCLAMVFYRAADLSSVEFWTKVLYFFPTFIPTAFLLFGFYFPKNQVKPLVLYLIIAANVIMAFLTLLSGAVIKEVRIIPGMEKVIIFGPAYYIFYNLYITGFFVASYIVLFKKYLHSNPYIKMQIIYILLGMTAASIPAMITNLNLPTYFKYFELNWVGQLFTVFWIGGVGYAIIKHRLMDVRLVVARSMTYSLLILILGAMYAGGLFIIGALLLGIANVGAQLIASTLLALAMTFTFQPIRVYLEKVTDKIFFKSNYSSNELLSRLTRILATTFRLEDIARKTLNQLFNTMRISSGAFFIFHSDKTTQLIDGGSVKKDKYDEKLMRQLCAKKEIIIFQEEDDPKNKEIMRILNMSIALPLHVGDRIEGLLLLGEKRSGDIYFDKDIELLKIFGPEVSVALENAKSYEEIQRFNIKLKQEVDIATEDLRAVNIKLQQVDRLKDEFVSLASHELRTPMTVIKSYLWMMLSKNNVPALSEKQRTYLDRAYISTQRLINLVNDMLNVSRIESGRFTVAMQSIDLVRLIATVHTEMLPKAVEQKINLQFARPLQPLPKVQADKERVEQVLINLIGNSLKFTPENGTIRIEINHNLSDSTEKVCVIDNGKGIKKEDIPKLFQKFSMVGNNYLVKQNTQGTGLGLYLSKSIVELMGGKIWVESEGQGKGSKFSFTLKTV